MKTIVAATDFSDDSLNAVNYAADMACITQNNLLLVHVCSPPELSSETPTFFSMEELIANAGHELKQLKEKLTRRTNGKLAITTMVKQGDIIDGIEECCTAENTFAIVMGRTNMGDLKRRLYGSRTVQATKRLSIPIITVPPGVKLSTIKNIGIACDFRAVTETLPAPGIRNFVQGLNAALHVLHVCARSRGDSFKSLIIEQSAGFRALLGDLAPHFHFIKSADPDSAIIELSEKLQLDLLIIIPKKHDIIRKVFGHSHSRQVVLHSHVPVMAIHE
jgi:nucleotide-binding universal stress UspA family protein